MNGNVINDSLVEIAKSALENKCRSENSIPWGETINEQIEEIEEDQLEEEDLPGVDSIPIPKKVGKYEIRGTIGEGSFSVVKLAYNPEEKRFYACKIIQKERLTRGKLESRFEAEIRIHQQLHHPGIVELVDILSDDVFYFVFMEFCPGGELFQYIVDRGLLTDELAKPILKQFMEAIAYIHSIGVAHRDLKPENLLLDQFAIAKLSDFGLSCFLDPQGYSHTPCGSPCYASPECLSGLPYDGKKSDIWSCGVILYAMVTGQLPWTKRNQTQLFEQIRRGEYSIPSFLSPDCSDLIRRMMDIDYRTRFSAQEVLQHPFLQGVQVESISDLAHFISLKKVEEFFVPQQFFSPVNIPRTLTFVNFGFEQIQKMISAKCKKRSNTSSKKPTVQYAKSPKNFK